MTTAVIIFLLLANLVLAVCFTLYVLEVRFISKQIRDFLPKIVRTQNSLISGTADLYSLIREGKVSKTSEERNRVVKQILNQINGNSEEDT